MGKEQINGNKAPASLYVGVGGIGGRIIRKVTEIAKNDDLSKARFVIMDTDVNDLGRANSNTKIIQIQTSSPRTVRDYLMQDTDARDEWFPNNMIINSKTVSEGAAQVRSISRLALNATIRTGKIKALYDAIDDLYDKDGTDKKQTVKISVVSTAAGGTGSGIAMIISMLIRNYISENYPDSSAIIRGFMLLPSILDSVKPSASEKLSLRRNGYATIKEINAFMMRPFFEATPELRRYLNLGVEVPNAAGGIDKLNCAPFDFCFLFDRTDGNVCNMSSLAQYEDYAAHSIYELFIGPMSQKASSKEDNIHKEFLDEKKLSRNRFCGAGAAVVRYPFEQIRNYVAYEWMEKQILGFSSEQVDEKDAKKLIGNGWLTYDRVYFDKMREYNQNPAGKPEPKRSDLYVSAIETGSDELSKRLREQFIDPKNNKYLNFSNDDANGNDEEKHVIILDDAAPTIPSVENYISELVSRACELYEIPYQQIALDFKNSKKTPAKSECFKIRYSSIDDAATKLVNPKLIEKTVKPFIESVFNGSAKMTDTIPEPYMLEALLSLDGKAMHPNAMRYILYKLLEKLEQCSKEQPSEESYKTAKDTICLGRIIDKDSGKRDISKFQVFGNGKEHTLEEMCDSCDQNNSESGHSGCNKLMNAYASTVDGAYKSFVSYYICVEAKHYVERLIAKYEQFYDRFEKKVLGLAKKKQTVLAAVRFANGDCEYDLFNNPKYLQMLAKTQMIPQSGGQHERDMYAGIYNGIKSNAQAESQKKNNVFSDAVEEDIFDDVMIKQFRLMVETETDLDMDIVRACGLEHKIACLCEAAETPNESTKEELEAKAIDSEEMNVHMIQLIKKGYNLACPSIIRKDFEEERAVNAMAFNKYMEDGDGMRLDGDYFFADYASDTVSKYEFRFYRSIYNVMPTQLQKLCPPQEDPAKLGTCIDHCDDTDSGIVGAYFTSYQDYMAKIGPDNRINPVITPHIDKRWNSLTILPELDPIEYQKMLMKKIHKAMIYGFIYKIIEKRMTSKYDTKKLVYEYIDGRNGSKKFIVSNHTKCDRLFEVLDALYFDRYAVNSIMQLVSKKRKKEYECSTVYEDTTFARYLLKLDRKMLIDDAQIVDLAHTELAEKAVSLFEIPMLYWNSLPRKDEAELAAMVDAIFEILEKNIGTFVSDDDFAPLVAKSIVEHYNLLYTNFSACPSVYVGISDFAKPDNAAEIARNDRALKLIRKKVLEKVSDLDVSDDDGFALADKTEMDDMFTD